MMVEPYRGDYVCVVGEPGYYEVRRTSDGRPYIIRNSREWLLDTGQLDFFYDTDAMSGAAEMHEQEAARLRAKIAALLKDKQAMTGPHFDMGPPAEDPNGRKHWDPRLCICGLTTYVDAATGYCRECWRAHRFQDDEATRIGRAMLSELRGKVFVKRNGGAVDFCEFGLFLLEQAGGPLRLLREWQLED